MIKLLAFTLLIFGSYSFALENKEKSCRPVNVEDLGWSLNVGSYSLEYADQCDSIEGEEVLSTLGYSGIQRESEFAYRKLYLLLKSGSVEKIGLLIYPNLDDLPKGIARITINSSSPIASILDVYKNSISKLYGCRDDSCADHYLSSFSLLGRFFNQDYRDFRDVVEGKNIGLAGFPPYTRAFSYNHLNNQITYTAEIPNSGLWYINIEVDPDGNVESLFRVAKSNK